MALLEMRHLWRLELFSRRAKAKERRKIFVISLVGKAREKGKGEKGKGKSKGKFGKSDGKGKGNGRKGQSMNQSVYCQNCGKQGHMKKEGFKFQRDQNQGKGDFFFGSLLLGSSPGRSALQSA